MNTGTTVIQFTERGEINVDWVRKVCAQFGLNIKSFPANPDAAFARQTSHLWFTLKVQN